VIEFIEHLHIVIKSKYNVVANVYTLQFKEARTTFFQLACLH
jgi:hypothetical protein